MTVNDPFVMLLVEGGISVNVALKFQMHLEDCHPASMSTTKLYGCISRLVLNRCRDMREIIKIRDLEIKDLRARIEMLELEAMIPPFD